MSDHHCPQWKEPTWPGPKSAATPTGCATACPTAASPPTAPTPPKPRPRPALPRSRTDQRREVFINPEDGKVTVREWVELWTDAHDVTKVTWAKYRSHLDVHI